MMDIFKLKKLGLFAGGVLFGTAGVKILGSEDAKKFYRKLRSSPDFVHVIV
ncbi:MAG: DUF6110 family protein [Clostridium fessum]